MTDQLFTRYGDAIDPARIRTDGKGPYMLERKICSRCGGDGIWKGHYQGTCYGCGGSGDKGNRVVKLYTAAQNAKLDAAKAKRDDKRAAKHAAIAAVHDAERAIVREIFDAEHPYIEGALEVINVKVEGDYTFGNKMADSLVEWGSLTPKQVDAVVAAAQSELAKRAAYEAAESVPTGRVAITGEILSTKIVESQYGSTLKMLVRDDRGFKVWGSMPSAIQGGYNDETDLVDDGADKGDRVTFTAAVEPSDDDDKFGFFKRPTKAAIINEEVAA